MKTKVPKWGNSLALRIPKSFAAETKLEPDTKVDLSLVKGKLIITPIIDSEYSLEQLLEGVTKQNIHAEVNTGISVGNKWLMFLNAVTMYGLTLTLKQVTNK